MAKRLFLLRHGKSDWGAEYGRPLNDRGRRAAASVGRFLAATGFVPEAVVSSTAVRARTTVEHAAEAGGWDVEIELDEALYGAWTTTVVDLVRRRGGNAASLMLVGHEPTWSETTSLLIGGGHVRFPTAAVAAIRFEVGRWSEIGPGGGMLEWMAPPKLIGTVAS